MTVTRNTSGHNLKTNKIGSRKDFLIIFLLFCRICFSLQSHHCIIYRLLRLFKKVLIFALRKKRKSVYLVCKNTVSFTNSDDYCILIAVFFWTNVISLNVYNLRAEFCNVTITSPSVLVFCYHYHFRKNTFSLKKRILSRIKIGIFQFL